MGVNFDTAFAGKTINAAYVKERGSFTAKILEADMIEFTDESGKVKEKKPALTLEGHDPVLPLNFTNYSTIRDAWGSDSDAYIGRTIKVTTHKVLFGGKKMDGILVEVVQAADSDTPFGPDGAKTIKAKLEKAGKDPKALRQFLVGRGKDAAVVSGSPASWPDSWMKDIDLFLTASASEEGVDDEDIPF